MFDAYFEIKKLKIVNKFIFLIKIALSKLIALTLEIHI
jgi:hypothetical protein